MSVQWDDLASVIGKPAGREEIDFLGSVAGENPEVSKDPEEYGGGALGTTYWEFRASGIQVGVRRGLIDFIFIFLFEKEGYSRYKGGLPSGIPDSAIRKDVISRLGSPSAEAVSRVDNIFGRVNEWIRYDYPGYSLRIEFSENEVAVFVALMKR